MLRITDVVKNLIILNVVIFFSVRYLIPIQGIEEFFVLVYPGSEVMGISGIIYRFEPVQIITHMFMHYDIKHLLFNMLGLFFLGPMVEATLGPKRFLTLYLVSGLAATLLHMLLVKGAVVGASGAVYGVLAAFATMFPNIEMMLMFIPVPIKAKYLAIGLIVFGLISGYTGMQSGIAHYAHVGGAVMGFLMILYWKMAKLR